MLSYESFTFSAHTQYFELSLFGSLENGRKALVKKDVLTSGTYSVIGKRTWKLITGSGFP